MSFFEERKDEYVGRNGEGKERTVEYGGFLHVGVVGRSVPGEEGENLVEGVARAWKVEPGQLGAKPTPSFEESEQNNSRR